MMVTAASNKKSDDDDVISFALQLFIAIKKLDYQMIEKLVKANRNKELLNGKEKDGNTFLHLVAHDIQKRRYNGNIPDVDDSAPLIQDVVFYISARLCAMILNNYLFPCFCRFGIS